MPAGMNTVADINSYIQTIYEDAMFVARDNNIMAALVTTFADRGDNSPRSSSEHSAVTINQIGETDDLASQTFTPSVLATLTPAEYGAQYLLLDQRIASDPFGVQADATQELGMGMAQAIETNVLSDFTSLTGGTVGAAGSAFTWGYFVAALTQLRGQNATPPYYFVCHPNQWHPLAKSASVAGAQVTNAPNFQDAVMERFYLGTIMGIPVFYSTNIAINAQDDATCAMFSRSALALDMRRPPRLEPQRDAQDQHLRADHQARGDDLFPRAGDGVMRLVDDEQVRREFRQPFHVACERLH